MSILMTITKKARNNCWKECREKGSLVQPLLKTIEITKKQTRIELPYNSANPLPGINIYLKKTKTLIQKDAYTLTFIAALFKLAQIRKQPSEVKVAQLSDSL